MKIFVDADACPVVDIIESIASFHSIPVVLLCDFNHMLRSDYSEVVQISAGADAVDYALINRCSKGDIVVTQGLRSCGDGTWKRGSCDPSERDPVYQR